MSENKFVIRKAFMLGAGLGTRLRPLTDRVPKPLVPLFHRPLVEWAMEACRDAGVCDFAINTHHLPDEWTNPDFGLRVDDWSEGRFLGANGRRSVGGTWSGCSVNLFHEPDLLETGGGIKNIASWIGEDDVLVHNGDIFSSIPLSSLIESHEQSDHLVTLALRSDGEARHIAYRDGEVSDIRGMIHEIEGTHVFSGIYCFSPGFLDRLPMGEKVSVIPAFLELIRERRLGAVVIDEGIWADLGDPESYLAAHQELALAPAVHEAARVAKGVSLESSVIGPDAEIGEGASLRNAVVWPGGRVQAGEELEGVI
ncbi:MAG: sugar phosphate nucleotidyltransferase, partial [Verrucomicrobiales bacterium]